MIEPADKGSATPSLSQEEIVALEAREASGHGEPYTPTERAYIVYSLEEKVKDLAIKYLMTINQQLKDLRALTQRRIVAGEGNPKLLPLYDSMENAISDTALYVINLPLGPEPLTEQVLTYINSRKTETLDFLEYQAYEVLADWYVNPLPN